MRAVLSRAGHLQALAPYQIDLHMIQGYDAGLNRWLHRTPRVPVRPEKAVVGGMPVTVHWFRHSLADTMRHRLLHRPPGTYLRWLDRLAQERLSGYDLISAHDRIAGTAAAFAARRHHIPHFITWHGASIYTDPPRDPVYRRATTNLLEQATGNFFVSRRLELTARTTLTSRMTSQVLYNGADEAFCCPLTHMLPALRRQWGLPAEGPVMAFVGRLEPVKNISLLPAIFATIARQVPQVTFVVAGTGSLQARLSRELSRCHLDVRMQGFVPHDRLPGLLQCADLLLLPSAKEGLPLVALEALQCGTAVVATRVGGIPELLPDAFTVPLTQNQWSQHLALRAAELLLSPEAPPPVPEAMSWTATARLENEIYQQYL